MNPTHIEVVSTNHNPLVRPILSIWGWQIPVYLFLGGVVAGVMVLLAALELSSGQRPRSSGARAMPFIALLLLSAGMGALLLDLEHKAHVYRFYLALRPASPMSWGAWILALVYPALALLGLGSLPEAQRQRLLAWRQSKALAGVLSWPLGWALRLADSKRRTIIWLNLATGAGLGLYTGLLLGTLAARAQWSQAVLGPLFLVSGVSTGAAALLLTRLDAAERHKLVRWDIAAVVIELALLGALLLGYLSSGAAGRAAAHELLGGDYTPAFWSLVVITGLLVPLSLELLELRRKLPLSRLAPAMILIGGLALRSVLVAAGQDAPVSLTP